MEPKEKDLKNPPKIKVDIFYKTIRFLNKNGIDRNSASRCVLSALQKGKYEMDMDAIILDNKCPNCEKNITAHVKDIINQKDIGLDYNKGSKVNFFFFLFYFFLFFFFIF